MRLIAADPQHTARVPSELHLQTFVHHVFSRRSAPAVYSCPIGRFGESASICDKLRPVTLPCNALPVDWRTRASAGGIGNRKLTGHEVVPATKCANSGKTENGRTVRGNLSPRWPMR